MDAIDHQITRRRVLGVGAGTAAGMVALAACGGGKSSGAATDAGSAPVKAPGGALASVADVPVGGAVSATGTDGKPVIVAQPEKGTLVAFSAICTHMGCTVAPQGKILACPCHGSTYDLATGDNTGGPAPRPLTEISVKVSGGKVVES